MRTGELARRAQVNVQTLRFYEREGLIRDPERSASGYRAYDSRDLERLVAIKRCQSLGFTLDEVREVLDLHDALAAPDADQRKHSLVHDQLMQRGRARLAMMEAKISALTQMRDSLERLVRRLSDPGEPQCLPGVDAVDGTARREA
jgi:MerR family copper efflux transcriptional regulator